MRRHHDMGGLPAGPLDLAEPGHGLWELRIDAIMRLVSSPGRRLVSVDERRRAVEDAGVVRPFPRPGLRPLRARSRPTGLEGTLEDVDISPLNVSPDVADFITAHRVGRLATADADGAPHAVPICYAYDGSCIYSALDLKPKRVQGRALKRVRNILENPRVALIIDDYSEDWDQLAYVLIRGDAHLVNDSEEQILAEAMLREKYPQYETMLEPGCAIIRLTPTSGV